MTEYHRRLEAGSYILAPARKTRPKRETPAPEPEPTPEPEPDDGDDTVDPTSPDMAVKPPATKRAPAGKSLGA